MSFWQSIKRAWHNANYPAMGIYPQDNVTPSMYNRRSSFNPYHPFNPGAVMNNGRTVDRLFEKTNKTNPPHVMDEVYPEQDSMDREIKKIVAQAKHVKRAEEQRSEESETFTFASKEENQKLLKILFEDTKAPDPKSDVWRGRVDNMLRIRDALEIELDPKEIANVLTIPECREDLKLFSKGSMSLESILGEVFAKVWGVKKVEAIEMLLVVLSDSNSEGEEK